MVVLKRLLLLAAIAGCDASQPPAPSPAAAVPSIAKKPEEAWGERCAAWKAGDARALWFFLCEKSRRLSLERNAREFEELKRANPAAVENAMKRFELTPEQLKGMNAEDFAIHGLALGLKKRPEAREALSKWEMVRSNVVGSRAFCTVRRHDGFEEEVVLVAEDGTWKVDNEETDKMNAE